MSRRWRRRGREPAVGGARVTRHRWWVGSGQVVAIAGRDLRSTTFSAFGIGCAAGLAALSGVVLVLDLRPGQARLDQWFAALVVVVGLVAVLVTTRSFAEEERQGSLELLLTAPVRTWQVVAGKLLGSVGALGLVLVTTVVCPLLVAQLGHPDGGPIVTGYAGLVLAGLAFTATGLAVSAATASSLVSGAGTAAALLGLWAGGLLATGLRGWPGTVLAYLSPASHLTGFLRGTISATDVAYFLSVAVIGFGATVAVLACRR